MNCNNLVPRQTIEQSGAISVPINSRQLTLQYKVTSAVRKLKYDFDTVMNAHDKFDSKLSDQVVNDLLFNEALSDNDRDAVGTIAKYLMHIRKSALKAAQARTDAITQYSGHDTMVDAVDDLMLETLRTNDILSKITDGLPSVQRPTERQMKLILELIREAY